MITIRTEGWRIVMGNQSFLSLLLKDWTRVIKEYKRIRTNKQNAYLWWGVYWTIAKTSWDEEDHIHEVCRMKFLKDNSRKLPFLKSTTKLTTTEFNEYVENIRNWMSEYWIIIPDPEEYENFIKKD